MRRLFSWILLGVFLFNLGGYYFVYRHFQYQIRREIKENIRKGIPDGEHTLISISINQISTLRWIKKGKEFIYRGQLYDVCRYSVTGRTIVYYCINDLKEKNLIANYFIALKQRNNNDKKIKKPASLLFLHSIYETSGYRQPVVNYYPQLSQNQQIITIAPLTPPPKVC